MTLSIIVALMGLVLGACALRFALTANRKATNNSAAVQAFLRDADRFAVVVEHRPGLLRDTKEMLQRRTEVQHTTIPLAEAKRLGLKIVTSTEQIAG